MLFQQCPVLSIQQREFICCFHLLNTVDKPLTQILSHYCYINVFVSARKQALSRLSDSDDSAIVTLKTSCGFLSHTETGGWCKREEGNIVQYIVFDAEIHRCSAVPLSAAAL